MARGYDKKWKIRVRGVNGNALPLIGTLIAHRPDYYLPDGRKPGHAMAPLLLRHRARACAFVVARAQVMVPLRTLPDRLDGMIAVSFQYPNTETTPRSSRGPNMRPNCRVFSTATRPGNHDL